MLKSKNISTTNENKKQTKWTLMTILPFFWAIMTEIMLLLPKASMMWNFIKVTDFSFWFACTSRAQGFGSANWFIYHTSNQNSNK